MAVTLVPARLGAILGNIVFGFAIDVNCAIPILSVATLLVSGGLVGLLLPNTTRQRIKQRVILESGYRGDFCDF